MSVREKLDSIKLHLNNAYAKIGSKGGVVPADKNMNNLANAIDTIEGGGGPSNIKLNVPVLSFGTPTATSDPLVITNTYNGNFVTSYDIYEGNNLLNTISANLVSNTINLKQYIQTIGTFIIKVVAKGEGFIDSNAASIIYSTEVRITNHLTNCSNSNMATAIPYGDSYNAVLEASLGYSFVGASITITMGGVDITSTAYKGKGVISIANVTGALVITATFALLTQLATPSISLSGSILTLTQVANAEKYLLCLSGNEWQEFPPETTTIDLADWLTIDTTYSVSVIARADGYIDSAESNVVTFTNSEGETPSATLGDNSWTTIRLVCEAGDASLYWSVGDTKTDVCLDGKTRTFRIVDMDEHYTGKHVVFEQIETENESVQWGDTYTQYTDGAKFYTQSYLYNNYLPALLLKYSDDLQRAITPTSYPISSNVGDVLYASSKLFTPNSVEYGSSQVSPYDNSPTPEMMASSNYKYYENIGWYDSTKRMKKNLLDEETTYWLRNCRPTSFIWKFLVGGNSGQIGIEFTSGYFYYNAVFAF